MLVWFLASQIVLISASNRADKKFYKAAVIRHWVMIIFEKRCSAEDAARMAQDLVHACQGAGKMKCATLISLV